MTQRPQKLDDASELVYDGSKDESNHELEDKRYTLRQDLVKMLIIARKDVLWDT